MNKKRVIIIVVSILLLIVIGIGSFLIYNNKRKSKDAETVKQLLTAISQNLVQYDQKGYVISFSQKYDVEYKNSTELEDVNFSISYEGEGNVKLSYKIEGVEKIEPKIKSLFLSDNAYLTGTQKEKVKHYSDEIRNIDGEKITRTDDTYLGIEYEFAVKIDDDNLYTASDCNYFDYEDEANNFNKSFCGKISKKVLSDAVSDEEMTDVVSGLLFMDAWKYINQIKELANDYLKNMDFSNNEAIAKFISDNGITVDEKADIVDIGFVLDSSRILSKITGKQVEHIANIYGTVKLDKNTGDVLNFKYDLSDCLLSMLMASGENKTYYKANVEEFAIEGEIHGKPLEDISLDNDFTEYKEEEKYDFINRFLDNVVPLYEREG